MENSKTFVYNGYIVDLSNISLGHLKSFKEIVNSFAVEAKLNETNNNNNNKKYYNGVLVSENKKTR